MHTHTYLVRHGNASDEELAAIGRMMCPSPFVQRVEVGRTRDDRELVLRASWRDERAMQLYRASVTGLIVQTRLSGVYATEIPERSKDFRLGIRLKPRSKPTHD